MLRVMHIPLSELLEENSVGETLSADPDTLKDTIAPQLVEYQVGIDLAGSLVVVRNDTSDEVRACAVQSVHQICQLLLKRSRK